MKVFRSLEEIRNAVKNPAVTIGSYDGVHIGHRGILDKLNDAARKQGGESLVITFDPHPRMVVGRNGEKPLSLNTTEEKIYLLGSAGVDNLLIINFTPEFGKLSSEEFARRYLFEGIGAKALIIGYNHQFGHNREGDKNYLEKLRKEYGFDLIQMPAIDMEEAKVSSTVIRELILGGDMATANKYLGSPYLIISDINSKGELEISQDKVLPPAGVYPISVIYGDDRLDATLEIREGQKPVLHGNGTDRLKGKHVKVFFKS